MRVDAFAHALPEALRSAVFQRLGSVRERLASWVKLRPLFDIGARLRLMDEHDIDLQIVTTPSPPLDVLFGGAELKRFARIANDAMAELTERHADRLRAVATVPLRDVEWAVEETRRAVEQLGMVGVLVYADPAGRPLDDPALEPFYRAVEELDVPLWLHPERGPSRPDYDGERRSRYSLHFLLGWPYETSIAVARLVMSGTLSRHPRLRVLVHHAGAMIPFLANRIAMLYQPSADGGPPKHAIVDEFRRLYVDTVTWGSVPALTTALELFGPEHMLFATDAPFGPEEGRAFVRAMAEAVERLPVTESERTLIVSGNAATFCRIADAVRDDVR